jgi:ABC-type Co2+ transport system permease subunit
MGFRIVLYTSILFFRHNCALAQRSNTVFVTAILGVFSWWLYVYAKLAGDTDGALDI